MSLRSPRFSATSPCAVLAGLFVATLALHAGPSAAHPGHSDRVSMSATSDRVAEQVRTGDDDPFDDPDMRHYPLSPR